MQITTSFTPTHLLEQHVRRTEHEKMTSMIIAVPTGIPFGIIGKDTVWIRAAHMPVRKQNIGTATVQCSGRPTVSSVPERNQDVVKLSVIDRVADDQRVRRL